MIPVLLAPVPSMHVDAALAVAGGVVAFGSGSPSEETSGAEMWQFFQRLDDEGELGRLPVCIYASQSGRDRAPHRYVGEAVSLLGVYEGSVPADRRGRHPDPSLRPATTLELDDPWSVFWHVRGFSALARDERVALHELRLARGGKVSPHPVGIPRGPVRAFAPDTIARLIG